MYKCIYIYVCIYMYIYVYICIYIISSDLKVLFRKGCSFSKGNTCYEGVLFK